MIKVLHFSTHNEECGIAIYQERYVAGMAKSDEVQNDYYPKSPNETKHMSTVAFTDFSRDLAHMAKDYDVVHIQHELGFYTGPQLDILIGAVQKVARAKVVVTLHTAPDVDAREVRLGGLGPRSFVNFAKDYRVQKKFISRVVVPLRKADAILVHNEITRQSLEKYNIDMHKVHVMRHPVPSVSKTQKSSVISDALNVKKNDVVMCTVGFLSENKGMHHAIRSLLYLPDNYKLAIIGGIHPLAGNEGYLDHLTDIIHELGLKGRVYITGFIEDNDTLDALIRECDICLYPFNKTYYKFVSSGSLNSAVANGRAVVAYRTDPLVETNTEMNVVNITKSDNYYELARAVTELDLQNAKKTSEAYAKLYDWDKMSMKMIDFYKSLI